MKTDAIEKCIEAQGEGRWMEDSVCDVARAELATLTDRLARMETALQNILRYARTVPRARQNDETVDWRAMARWLRTELDRITDAAEAALLPSPRNADSVVVPISGQSQGVAPADRKDGGDDSE